MSRFAIQTIAWGENHTLEQILSDVVTAGYEGIELFQHPEELGGMDRLIAATQAAKIQIVGFCAGAFEERCNLVREYCSKTRIRTTEPHAPYVYCDEWKSSPDQNSKFEKALSSGLRIALHPHMYKPVQTMREAEQILDTFPMLKFLPDTAHITIAGDDPVEAIRKYFNRLAAIHMKDWKEDVGRSFQFYSRGFCELGAGNIQLNTILDVVATNHHRGWIVVEQETTPSPLKSTSRSLQWLKNEVLQRRLMDPDHQLKEL